MNRPAIIAIRRELASLGRFPPRTRGGVVATAALHLVILFNPAVLAVNSVSLGDAPSAHAEAGWSGPLANIDNTAGRLIVGLSNQQGLGGRFSGSLVNIEFTVQAEAGATAINLVASLTEPLAATNLNEGGLALVPAPTNAATDAVDGRIAVLVPGWHNFSLPWDVTGDGRVTGGDVPDNVAGTSVARIRLLRRPRVRPPLSPWGRSGNSLGDLIPA